MVAPGDAGSRTPNGRASGAAGDAAWAGRYLSLYTYSNVATPRTSSSRSNRWSPLLGFALPAPASSERDWWTSPTDDLDQHSDAWTVACRIATPNLLARTVAFERVL